MLWPDSRYFNVRMVKCFYLGSISCCCVRKPFDYLKNLNEANYIQIQGHVTDFIFCKKLWHKLIYIKRSNCYGNKNVIHILKWIILLCLCRQNDFYRVIKQYREIQVISKNCYSAFLRKVVLIKSWLLKEESPPARSENEAARETFVATYVWLKRSPKECEISWSLAGKESTTGGDWKEPKSNMKTRLAGQTSVKGSYWGTPGQRSDLAAF